MLVYEYRFNAWNKYCWTLHHFMCLYAPIILPTSCPFKWQCSVSRSWAFLAVICSSWVPYPALSVYSLLRKPFSFLCPRMNFNAPHVSYLSSQGQGAPEFNKVWQVEVIYRKHRPPCSIINKIKVVSSIPSTWLESGRVGPRTSAHVWIWGKSVVPAKSQTMVIQITALSI